MSRLGRIWRGTWRSMENAYGNACDATVTTGECRNAPNSGSGTHWKKKRTWLGELNFEQEKQIIL